MRWPAQIPAGRVLDDLVNLMDLAPTFLEAGGVAIPTAMTGRSLLPMLRANAAGQVDPERTWVITGRERHVAAARDGRLPYPQRALRTKEHLFIVNFKPDRWPMGDPKTVAESRALSIDELTNNTFVAFADLDASPTKAWLVTKRESERKLYDLAFGKRPQTELYVLANDPNQIHNVADEPEFAALQQKLHDRLLAELKRLGDPRVSGDGQTYERPPFAGG